MDPAEWLYTLIAGIIGIGIAIMIAQEFCKLQPESCSIFYSIIGAAVIGLIVALKFGLMER